MWCACVCCVFVCYVSVFVSDSIDHSDIESGHTYDENHCAQRNRYAISCVRVQTMCLAFAGLAPVSSCCDVCVVMAMVCVVMCTRARIVYLDAVMRVRARCLGVNCRCRMVVVCVGVLVVVTLYALLYT